MEGCKGKQWGSVLCKGMEKSDGKIRGRGLERRREEGEEEEMMVGRGREEEEMVVGRGREEEEEEAVVGKGGKEEEEEVVVGRGREGEEEVMVRNGGRRRISGGGEELLCRPSLSMFKHPAHHRT